MDFNFDQTDDQSATNLNSISEVSQPLQRPKAAGGASVSISGQPIAAHEDDDSDLEPSPFDLASVIQGKQESAGLFDPSRFRVSQEYATSAGVQKVHTTIPVRKPTKEWFVRTHPDEAFRMSVAVVELKEDRELYLVVPELWAELASEATFSPRLMVAAVNRGNVPFLWPIRLPGPDGKIDSWNQSALDAANMARNAWVRVSANMALGAYDVAVATGIVAQPVWPNLDFGRMLELGFRGKIIESMDHAILKRLRGEI